MGCCCCCFQNKGLHCQETVACISDDVPYLHILLPLSYLHSPKPSPLLVIPSPLPSPPLLSPLLSSYAPTTLLTCTFPSSTSASHFPYRSIISRPYLPLLTGPMCAPCSRSWGPRRSTSARVGTGTKAPSAARRRKS